MAGEKAVRAQSGWVEVKKGPREGRHKEQIKLFGDDSSLEYFSLLKISKSYYLPFYLLYKCITNWFHPTIHHVMKLQNVAASWV